MGDKQNLAKESQLALKQDKLIAGANITIALDGKTISAANPTSVTVTPVYQAGTLVAAIIVNGNTTNIYAPAQHGDNSNQNLAVPFSAAQTYEEGDFVIYQENLYKCTTAIDTPAAWDSTKWMRALITDEMGQGSGGDYANQNIANTYDITSTYDVGDYVIYAGLLYKCTTAVTTPGSWDTTYWKHCIVTDEMGSGSVEPNPQGTATDTLNKIEIDGTIYEIEDGADYVELTQAQYNALTPAQKMDGTMYLITDGGSSEPGSATYYGTTEPLASLGQNGDMYVVYDDTNDIITTMYIKINGDWLQTPSGGGSGGSYVRRVIPSEGTASHSTITVQEAPTE